MLIHSVKITGELSLNRNISAPSTQQSWVQSWLDLSLQQRKKAESVMRSNTIPTVRQSRLLVTWADAIQLLGGSGNLRLAAIRSSITPVDGQSTQKSGAISSKTCLKLIR